MLASEVGDNKLLPGQETTEKHENEEAWGGRGWRCTYDKGEPASSLGSSQDGRMGRDGRRAARMEEEEVDGMRGESG